MAKRKMYEIQDDIDSFWESYEVDEETGEVLTSTDALDSLKMEKADKLEGCALKYKELDYEDKALTEEIQRLTKMRKTVRNKKDGIFNYINYWSDGEELVTTKVSVKYRRSEYVDVKELGHIPDEYLKTTIEPKKKELMAALKDGEIIEGVSIEERYTMSIK